MDKVRSQALQYCKIESKNVSDFEEIISPYFTIVRS
jgi:hypothetical protein